MEGALLGGGDTERSSGLHKRTSNKLSVTAAQHPFLGLSSFPPAAPAAPWLRVMGRSAGAVTAGGATFSEQTAAGMRADKFIPNAAT